MAVEKGRAYGTAAWPEAPQPKRHRLVSCLARAHVAATRNPEVCSSARGRAPPAAFPAAGPPAPEEEATGGLPPGAAAAAIHWQHLLPGHVCRASPRLHEEAEPGIWRGRPRRRPSPVRSSGQRESRLEGRAPDRKPPQRRQGSRFPPTGEHVRVRCVACSLSETPALNRNFSALWPLSLTEDIVSF